MLVESRVLVGHGTQIGAQREQTLEEADLLVEELAVVRVDEPAVYDFTPRKVDSKV